MDGERILVVEDDELVRSFLCRALATVAGTVESCATGADAVRAVAAQGFSVLLIDGLLPDTHGIELARSVVQHPNAARSGICFVSGSLRMAQPISDGVCALPKPLRVRELVDTVEALLAWRRGPAVSIEDRIAAVDTIGADLLVR